jgi:hypothetical protein
MPLVHEELLIKVCPFRDDHLLGLRVVELPCLVSLRVPNEDALPHVQPKAPKRPLVLLNEHTGSAAPDIKHRQIRLTSKE